MAKSLEYYRGLPYTKIAEIVLDESPRPYWGARVVELDGCIATGSTEVEAMRNLDHAFDEYIEALLQWGDEIHEPEPMRVETTHLESQTVTSFTSSAYERCDPIEVEGTAASHDVSSDATINRAETHETEMAMPEAAG